MRQIRKLKDLAGYHLNALDGVIGELKQVYFDDRHWVVRYLVVHTGNWLLGQDVLIVPEVIQRVDEEKQCLDTGLTRLQIEQAPPIDTQQPVSRHYEMQYYRHYGWQPYWGTDSFLSPPLFLTPDEDNLPDLPDHPHLRSSQEVNKYRIHAQDGEIGKIADFLLDDKGWSIRYLVINTGKWLPGKKVLISPAWILQIDWTTETIVVTLTCERIRSAPEYDPTEIISPDYELALYKHYGKAKKHE